MRRPSGVRLLCLAAMLAAAPACLLEEERPRVAIVVGGEASELESLAASELASMLEKLFKELLDRNAKLMPPMSRKQ